MTLNAIKSAKLSDLLPLALSSDNASLRCIDCLSFESRAVTITPLFMLHATLFGASPNGVEICF